VAEIVFEWDEEKNKLNQKRHGIAFEDAIFVFNDPYRIILPDLYHSENIIRIISARIATKTERSLYNDQNKQA